MASFETGASAWPAAASARKRRRTGAVFVSLGFAASMAAFGFGVPAAAQDERPLPPGAFAEMPSGVLELRNWVLATGDNQGRSFVIVDKLHARAAAFDPAGAMLASTPVLLGLAQGDDSPAGIGDRALASIGPADRITPAGRFSGQLGENLAGRTVLWVDYDAAISLHPVATAVISEHRQARLDSATISDNRISYGCINVPAAFYSSVILPLFKDTPGLVYVMPETRSLDEEFFRATASRAPEPARPIAMPASLRLVSAEAQLANQVLAEVNFLRADPVAYVRVLQAYRAQFRGDLVIRPNGISIQTREGVAAVDEAIAYLRVQPPMSPLDADSLRDLAASDHVRDQGLSGSFGHPGADGWDFSRRVARRGGEPYGGENISYGYDTAREIVIQLVVDDAIADRGHRVNLFRPGYVRAGVACGPHPVYSYMCVIDFGYAPTQLALTR